MIQYSEYYLWLIMRRFHAVQAVFIEEGSGERGTCKERTVREEARGRAGRNMEI